MTIDFGDMAIEPQLDGATSNGFAFKLSPAGELLWGYSFSSQYDAPVGGQAAFHLEAIDFLPDGGIVAGGIFGATAYIGDEELTTPMDTRSTFLLRTAP